jgi:hypothetical protein
MKAGHVALAGAATVQFSSLALIENPETRFIGFVTGMIMGTILLLLAVDVGSFRTRLLPKRDTSISRGN